MSLQTRLEAFIAAVGTDIKALQAGGGTGGSGDMVLAAVQTITGTKTFAAGTLLMRNAAGTVTAEPYSDVNPPQTLMLTDIADASVTTPPAGLTQIFTNDGKLLETKDDDGIVRPVDMSWENCPFSSVGALTVKVGANRYPVKGGTFQIQTVAVMVGTAPTGASVIVDVNKNLTSIYTTQANRPTIAAGATAATVGAHAATTVTDGDHITVDIDQIGSTVAGSDLTAVIRMQRIV